MPCPRSTDRVQICRESSHGATDGGGGAEVRPPIALSIISIPQIAASLQVVQCPVHKKEPATIRSTSTFPIKSAHIQQVQGLIAHRRICCAPAASPQRNQSCVYYYVTTEEAKNIIEKRPTFEENTARMV